MKQIAQDRGGEIEDFFKRMFKIFESGRNICMHILKKE